MTFLPIVARELRVASRRGATYWTRFTAGVLAITVGAFAWALLFRQSPRETGFWIFVWLSVIAFLHSLFAGSFSTADCVSEEKREGTLGLLFLTDLKAYDIVLGKLAATSLTAIYGLLAIFPLMGVPLLLGGVAPSEFVRVLLVCLNNLFLSLAIGMLCSALCKDERKAIGATSTTLTLHTITVPGLVAWIASHLDTSHSLYWLFNKHPYPLLAISPGFGCAFAFDLPHKQMMGTEKVDWFYFSLAINHLLGWLALVLTTIVLPRVWQDKAATKEVTQRRETIKQWLFGNAEARAAFRRHLLAINPFYWLASRERFKVALVWAWFTVGALFWLVGLIRERRDWMTEGIYVCTALLAHASLKCWIAIEASRRLGADRRSGALELLLSTPLSVAEIMRGQWLALVRQFGGATAVVCALDLLFLGLGCKLAYNADERTLWILVWLAGILIFVLDMVTLPPLAMWLSLSGRKNTRAGTSALVLVCIIPWFVLCAFAALVEIVAAVSNTRPIANSNAGWTFLGVWFAASVVIDVLLASWSLKSLKAKFRLVATQRAESRGAIWGRWFGRKVADMKR
jgi:ABC-type Na+ efflux pump permease subunit